MKDIGFSVIIPVYNVERYLRECIDSVLAQTYKDFEIILVDDGSQDQSGSVCDEYSLRDSKVRVIHKKNEGLISARRAGLKASRGDYICFVDSDDTIHSCLLMDIAHVVERTNADVISFKWTRTDLAGRMLREETAVFPEGIVSKRTYIRKVASSFDLNSLCKKICRRELFDIDSDYREYYCLSQGEDLLQTIPILERARVFYYLDKSYYYYRTNPTSISNNYKKGQYQSLQVIRPMLFQCMMKLGYDTEEDLEAFFSQYLRSLLEKILQYCRFNNYCEDVFREIYGYPFVQKAHEYIYLMGMKERIGLWLFFSRKWRLLYFGCKLYVYQR